MAAAATCPRARWSSARPGCGSRPSRCDRSYASSAAVRSPRSRWRSPSVYQPSAAGARYTAAISALASRASRSAPAQSPSTCMSCARWTRQMPPKTTGTGSRGQPTFERSRPLPRPSEVTQLPAGRDQVAVDVAGERGRQLVGERREHRLVQQLRALRGLSRADPGSTLHENADRNQHRILVSAAQVLQLCAHPRSPARGRADPARPRPPRRAGSRAPRTRARRRAVAARGSSSPTPASRPRAGTRVTAAPPADIAALRGSFCRT